MRAVRAKFRCSSIESFAQTSGQRVYKFSAEYDADLPEDQRYAKYTPAGQLSITVDNPNVSFELGHSYYLDFAPVEV